MSKSNRINNDKIISITENWFKNTPDLPTGIKEILVIITPWIALVFGIISVIGSLIVIRSLFMPSVSGSSGLSPISALLGLVSSILLAAAFPGTKSRRLEGWTFLYWSQMVSVVNILINFNLAAVISAIISFIIGFYLLFQIKSYYK